MNAPSVSVVLPVYNQADHIEEAIHEFHAALERIPSEVEILLVINGPQRDDSLAICNQLAAELNGVRVIVSDRGGWGLAVRLGLKEATGDILCYTNGARTSVESLILVLLYAVAFPKAIVKANRKMRTKIARRLGSLLYNLECRHLFDLAYWDINGTPKVFPRRLSELLALERDDDLIDLEFNLVCRDQAYPVLEVPVFANDRKGGSSTTTLKSAWRMYFGAWSLYRSRKWW